MFQKKATPCRVLHPKILSVFHQPPRQLALALSILFVPYRCMYSILGVILAAKYVLILLKSVDYWMFNGNMEW